MYPTIYTTNQSTYHDTLLFIHSPIYQAPMHLTIHPPFYSLIHLPLQSVHLLIHISIYTSTLTILTYLLIDQSIYAFNHLPLHTLTSIYKSTYPSINSSIIHPPTYPLLLIYISITLAKTIIFMMQFSLPCTFGFLVFIFTHSSKNWHFKPAAGIISLKCQLLGSPHLKHSYDPYSYDVIQILYSTHDTCLSSHCSLSDLSLITVLLYFSYL